MSLPAVLVASIALRASADTLWCLSNAPKNACGQCQIEADCGNTNKAVFFCSNMRDSKCGPAPAPPPGPPGPPSPPPSPVPPPGPATSWCKHDSPQNACKPCDGQESACGNDDSNKYFCLKAEEPACSGPAPSPPGPPGPATAWCKHDAPQNACKPCDGMESACGNSDPSKYFCLAAKEPACSNPAPGPGPATAWCKHDAPQNACKPCDGMESACGNSDPSKYFCLASKEPACGSPPTPGGGGYCAADSPQNACGRCPTMSESECGNTQPGVYKCWGLPDQRCHANTTSTFLI